MSADLDMFPWEDAEADGEQGSREEPAQPEPEAAEASSQAESSQAESSQAESSQAESSRAESAQPESSEPEERGGPEGRDAGAEGGGATEPPADSGTQDVQPRRTEAGARPLVRKEYYSISEVSDLVGLPAHVLRYWESQFTVLSPSKNRSGNRVYQRKEIKLILLVKKLLHEEKYTVEGAKQKLDQLRRGGGLGEASVRALDEQMVSVLREELVALGELLKVDAD